MLGNILESMMMLAFGLAWPANIIKSWRTRSTYGKSLSFLIIVEVGYLCGITAKLVTGNINYVLFFYCLNVLMVGADLLIYARNHRLDLRRKAGV